MRLGAHHIAGNVILAPMAGVTDAPFRRLCRRLGAAYAVSEMVTSDRRLWHTAKSRTRLPHHAEARPRVVQIAGRDPAMLADAARANVDLGADVIDINMGCPAKKVCNAACGSALLADEPLVARILDAVIAAVDVPVTLKIRTGSDPSSRNGVRIARIAEAAGVAALAVHGRTRACRFNGQAEHETLRAIRGAVTMPLIANGDIRSPQQARAVLEHTGADAVMLGRAAQGDPWVLGRVQHYLDTGRLLAAPSMAEVGAVLDAHLRDLHELYGEARGVRVARKHLAWYCRGRRGAQAWWDSVNRVESAERQRAMVRAFFEAGPPALGVAA